MGGRRAGACGLEAGRHAPGHRLSQRGEDAGRIDYGRLRPQDVWALRVAIGEALSQAHPAARSKLVDFPNSAPRSKQAATRARRRMNDRRDQVLPSITLTRREDLSMSLTPSTMLPLGTSAPGFQLSDTDGKIVSLDDFQSAPGLLVVFLCNHCPYVKHVRASSPSLPGNTRASKSPSSASTPTTRPPTPTTPRAKMVVEKAEVGYTFPYLYDESQHVALAYQAACTPDFYVFDRNQKLVYRGQMDGSRPGNAVPVTGVDLRAALDAVLAGKPVSADQRPSMGCNIKWKPGNEPRYA